MYIDHELFIINLFINNWVTYWYQVRLCPVTSPLRWADSCPFRHVPFQRNKVSPDPSLQFEGSLRPLSVLVAHDPDSLRSRLPGEGPRTDRTPSVSRVEGVKRPTGSYTRRWHGNDSCKYSLRGSEAWLTCTWCIPRFETVFWCWTDTLGIVRQRWTGR